jgi:hypothetical protein
VENQSTALQMMIHETNTTTVRRKVHAQLLTKLPRTNCGRPQQSNHHSRRNKDTHAYTGCARVFLNPSFIENPTESANNPVMSLYDRTRTSLTSHDHKHHGSISEDKLQQRRHRMLCVEHHYVFIHRQRPEETMRDRSANAE